MYAISPVRLAVDNVIVEQRTVLAKGRSIVGIIPAAEPIPPDAVVIDGHDALIIPGMIDIHIHGANGFDMTDGTAQSILETSFACAKFGCTAFLATSLTSSFADLLAMVQRVKEVQGTEMGAKVLGMHLEGPYLNEKRRGMQNPHYLRQPDLGEMETILAQAPGLVRMVTIAPELPNAPALIQRLKSDGIIVSIGHSDATYEEACDAFNLGISHVTHCFNALRPIHHRNPGAVVAAMERSDVVCEAIVDHVHLHPAIVRLLYRNKGRHNMVLITDAMQAMGLGDGRYRFGGHEVDVQDGIARMKDGNLASSTITMNRALQKTVDCGIPLADAIVMATQTPADMLGFSQKGRIALGMDADLVLLNDDFDVMWTMVEGRVVYQRDGGHA